MDRRQLISGAGALALSSTFSAAGAWAQSPRIRRDVGLLDSNDPFFDAYALAVRRMHELAPSDPRHWSNQARIHLRHCPHGRATFCHWHRHYLARFEAICASVLGEPDFALPYWDWAANSGVIPAPFFDRPELSFATWDIGADGDVGTEGKRSLTKDKGLLADSLSGADFAPSKLYSILVYGEYENFRRALERPHNNAHVIIGRGGGHMSSMMSPLDPLFWLHHCNVDRLWAQWQAAGNTSPPLSENYGGQFVGADGAPVQDATSANALDIAAFGYTYDVLHEAGLILRGPWSGAVDGAGAGPSSLRVQIDRVGRASQGEAILGGTAREFAVSAPNLERNLLDRTRSRTFWLPNAALERPTLAERRPRVVASLKNVRLASHAPDVTARVFVNCPYLAPDTPASAPHYAGSCGFFGASHHGAPVEFDIDLTDTLLGLAGQGQIDFSEINLQVVATGADQATPVDVTVGEVEIVAI